MKLFFITILLILSTTTISYSKELKNYEFTYQDEDLIIAFTLDENAQTEIFNLKNPFRLILTLKDTSLNSKIKSKNEINNEIIKNIMAVQFSRNGKNNTKIILSLKKEVAYTVDKFNNRILLILKNVKTSKQDKIAQKIEENEKKVTEKPTKTIEKLEEIKLKNMLTNVSYQYIDEDLVISIKTNKPTSYKAFELVSPFRIFLDINNVELSTLIKKENKYNDEYFQKTIINKMSRNGKPITRVAFFFKDKKTYLVEQFKNNIVITIKGAKKLRTIVQNEKKNIKKEEKPKEAKLSNEKLIDYNYNDNSLLIAIKLKKDTKLKSYNLINPFRIIMDLKNTSLFKEKMKEIKYNDKYIKDMKFIKYKKNGIINTKAIILFHKYAPYQVENINNTILITLSNIINSSDSNNVSENENNNVSENENNDDLEISSDGNTEKPEETISFKKKEKQKELKTELDTSLKNNDISLTENAPIVKTTNSNISSKKHNLLNKVVFKKYENKARIIIETKNPASYQTELDGNTFSIILNNTSFKSRMASLTLNTEFFKTNVKKIIPKHKGKNIIIKLNLSKSQSPKIKQSENQLFLDF